MILWAFFCLSMVAATLGESPSGEGYDHAGYEAESPGRRIVQNSNPQGENERFLYPGSEEDAEKEEDRVTSRRGIVDPEVTDQLEGNGWLDVIPGTPGKDYPNYERIPRTSFTCGDKTPGGYYADIEARCQVFHVCSTGGEKSSFLCPSGSIFNQKYFVCDWWYDFECDDATDLYSLNEKVNRGGTGSGPSGPGRIEENIEYSFDEGNFPTQEIQHQGNFVSADGFDLSLAGTGEGGVGYARNGNNKGYQSNVDDEDRKEKQNARNQEQGTRPKGLDSRKPAYSSASNNKKQEKNQDFESSKESPSSSVKEDSKLLGSREHFRDKNSPGINYQPGYEGRNSNVPLKTNNFRAGNGRSDRAEQPNRFNENGRDPSEGPSQNTPNNENGNSYDNHAQRSAQKYEDSNKNHNRNENRDGFGQRSSTGQSRSDHVASRDADDNYSRGSSPSGPSSGFNNQDVQNFEVSRRTGDQEGHKDREFGAVRNSGLSSGSNNNEYGSSSGTRPGNIRGRQRTSGGLQPGGLGNGYPSPGGLRELPGSDAIAGGITEASGETVYDDGDERSSNSQHRTSSSGRKNTGEVRDGEKIGLDHQSRHWQRSNFRSDGNFSGGDSLHHGESSKNGKHSAPNHRPRNEGSFDPNNRESNKRVTDQDHQGSGKNYGNDYLVGIVPGMEDRGNGSSGSNQPRRYLPIL